MTSPVLRVCVPILMGVVAVAAISIGTAVAAPALLVALVLAGFAVWKKQTGPPAHTDPAVPTALDLAGVGILTSIGIVSADRFQTALGAFELAMAIGILAGAVSIGTIVSLYRSTPFLDWLVAVLGGILGGGIAYRTGEPLTDAVVHYETVTVAVVLVIGAIVAAFVRGWHRRLGLTVTTGVLLVVVSLFGLIGVPVSPTTAGSFLLAAIVLGIFAYVSQTATIGGMNAGILLAIVTLIYGGVGWFAVIFAFVTGGAIATKYRYAEKAARGVAEPDLGARGIGNVMGNATVALFTVIGYGATADSMPGLATLCMIAFVGSLATALADTLSSELGVLFGTPRLITTFGRVEPGANGGVTWQGALAGVGGAVIIGVVSFFGIDEFGALATVIVVLAGVIGMFVDSLLGATLEDRILTNQSVNLLATLSGGIVAVLGLLLTGTP